MLFREWCSTVKSPCLWLQVFDYVFLEDYEFVCHAAPVFVVSELFQGGSDAAG